MSQGRFRVGYLDRVPHPAFLDAMAPARDAIDLVCIPSGGDPEEATRALATCHGYYISAARDELPRRWHATAAFLDAMPNLVIVSSQGAGHDTIDAAACAARGVAACCQSGGNAEGVAEQTLGVILSLLKRVPEGDAAIRRGEARDRSRLLGRELAGRTVGLVGIGNIGTRTAHYLKAFGCRVLAHDPYVDREAIAARGAEKVDLERLLAESDIVSLHCPLTVETAGMFGAEAFAAMRPGALFVTTARGGIHDEAALHDALVRGHIAGAGLDVWAVEPPPPDHPLLSHPSVIATPHIAGVTDESRRRVTAMAAETFIAASRREVPPRLIDPASAEGVRARLAAAVW